MVSQITTRMVPSVETQLTELAIEEIGMAPAVNVELITSVSVRCVGVIDTGSDLSVLDETLFQKLGSVVKISSVRTIGVSGSMNVSLYLIGVRITGDNEGETITFDNVPIIVTRLHRPLLMIGRRGILDRLKVELDFARERVTLTRPIDLEKEFPSLAREFSSLQSLLDAFHEGQFERVILSLFRETEQFLDRLIIEHAALRPLKGRGLRGLNLHQKFKLIGEQMYISEVPEFAQFFDELTSARNQVAHNAGFKGLHAASVDRLITEADRVVFRLREYARQSLGEKRGANVYIEARPRGRTESSPIDDYVVEDHADHVLATFKTQREAINWAKKNGHTPLVARVRHLSDKKKPDHWRAA
jgi:hypothetical protein